MRLYSYVLARDYGFAPNPFHGVCTLATCKPQIRRVAQVGDWIIGTGSIPNGMQGHLIYAMKVTESLSFDAYWSNPRFQCKKPKLRGSLKQAYGDNIYHHTANGDWIQADSHHSFADGSPNPANISRDTSTDRVLISEDFVYWGARGPRIQQHFRDYNGEDICAGRGYRCRFSSELVEEFLAWLVSLGDKGFKGPPRKFV